LIKDSANDAKTHMTNNAMRTTEFLLHKDLGNDEDGYRDLTKGEFASVITQFAIDPKGMVASSASGRVGSEVITDLTDKGEVTAALGVTGGHLLG